MSMMVHELVHSAVLRFGDAIATSDERGQVSYARLWERSTKLATALAKLGVGHGSRVVALMNNRNEWLEVDNASSMLGAVRGRLNARDSVREFTWVLNDLTPTVVITGPEFTATLRTLREQVGQPFAILELGAGGSYEAAIEASDPHRPQRFAEDDPYLVFHTSGTTGKYKGAIYTHRRWLNVCRNILACVLDDVGPGSVLAHVAAVTHMSGILINPGLFKGARSHMMEKFTPELFFAAVAREKITHVILAPAMITALVNDPSAKDHDLRSLKRIYYAAAPIAPTTLRAALEIFGPIFVQGYGVSESGTIFNSMLSSEEHVAALAHQPSRLASAGRAIPFFDVELMDLEGKPVAVGEIGEIWVRGDSVSTGYWNNPEASAVAFAGGWFHTGDLAVRDEDGYLTITDRKHDMIISGGFNVYPREVEDVLASHPSVYEAVVIGVPDATYGEAVKACVALRPGASLTLEEVQAHCAQIGLAGYKKPRSLDVVAEIPKSAVGKLLRAALRQPYWEGQKRRVS